MEAVGEIVIPVTTGGGGGFARVTVTTAKSEVTDVKLPFWDDTAFADMV